VADGLRRLEDGGKRDAEEVKELKGVVEGVERGLGDAVEGIKRNWEGLEGRMRDVEERLRNIADT
jgi:nuclear migration protein JNM1